MTTARLVTIGLVVFLCTPVVAQERGTITLEEARAMFVEVDRNLEISALQIEQARLLEDQARSVLLPNVRIGFDYTFRDTEVEFELPNLYAPLLPYLDSVYESNAMDEYFAANPGALDARMLASAPSEPSIIQFQHDYRLTVALQQTVFDFRALSLLAQAKTTLEQAEASRETLLFQLNGALEALFFDAVSTRRLVEVGQGNVEIAQIAFERATVAFEEEVGNRFELNRAEVAVETARRELESMRLAYELMLEALRAVLQLDEPLDTVPPSALEYDGDLESALESALARRPELHAGQLALQLDEERLDEIRAGWWPTIHAQAQAATVRESAFSGDSVSWTLGLSLNWNIWDGGLRIAQRKVADLDLVQHQLAWENQVNLIESEVRSAWLRLESQRRSMPSVRAEAELAERNVWVTQEALSLGAATALDVEVAEENLQLARIALAVAEVRLQALTYDMRRLACEDSLE